MTDAAMVRVRWHATFSDSLAGMTFCDGVSDPVSRDRAARFVARVGPPAVIVEAVTPSEPASLASEPPPSSDAGDAAPDLPSDPAEPAPADDAPSPADTAPKPRKAPR